MAEYIEREAAIAFMNEVEPCICRNPDGAVFTATKDGDMLEYLRSIPAADVVPVRHGRWINEPGHIPHCSECGRYSDDADTGEAICCPFCGARMDGDA